MKKNAIVWKQDGWTIVQDADAKKHVLELSCRAEAGVVVEVRIRHNDGEDQKGYAVYEGKNALPMPIDEFAKLYTKGELTIKE